MSKVYVADDYGFVGWNGTSIYLEAGAEYDSEDQIVKDMPERFTARSLAPDDDPRQTFKRRGGRRG